MELEASESVTLALYWRAKELKKESVLLRLKQKVLKIKEERGWSWEETEEIARRCYEKMTEVK